MTGQINGVEKGAGLRQRLEAGPLICAEGYLFELERRGYLQAGAFVPEVVLEFPEAVTEGVWVKACVFNQKLKMIIKSSTSQNISSKLIGDTFLLR